MKRVLLILLILLTGCASRTIENKDGKRGEVRDAIYSTEPRANGAYVVWLRYDNEGVYCTDDAALFAKIRNIHREGSGWAFITYHTVISGVDTACYDVESTASEYNTTHTIYVINTVDEVKGD